MAGNNYFPNVNPGFGGAYGSGGYNPAPDIAAAANLGLGENPQYTAQDFFDFYPNFQGIIPEMVLARFLAMANAVVKAGRWHDHWYFGMANYIGHFCAVYLQVTQGAGQTGPKSVLAAAEARGQTTSESAGGLSVGIDYSALNDDLHGWAMFKTTSYGQQYATEAKRLNRGPMGVR